MHINSYYLVNQQTSWYWLFWSFQEYHNESPNLLSQENNGLVNQSSPQHLTENQRLTCADHLTVLAVTVIGAHWSKPDTTAPLMLAIIFCRLPCQIMSKMSLYFIICCLHIILDSISIVCGLQSIRLDVRHSLLKKKQKKPQDFSHMIIL